MENRERKMSLSRMDFLVLERYHAFVLRQKVKVWGRFTRVVGFHLKRERNDVFEMLNAALRVYNRQSKEKSLKQRGNSILN